MKATLPARDWISKDQAAELLVVGVRRVEQLMQLKKIERRDGPLTGGRPSSELSLASLFVFSPAAQLRYQEQIAKSVAVAVARNGAKSSATDRPREKRERSDVPEWAREIVEKWKVRIGGLLEWAKLPKREKVTTFAEVLRIEAKKHITSPSTLRRRFDRFRTRGEAGLAPKLREDEGKSRFARHHPKAALFCQQKFLGESLSAMLVWIALKREWLALGESGKVPCYNTVLKYLNTIRPDVQVLAREGAREYHRVASPHIVRDRRGIAANDWWVLDHRVHDVFVYNEVFPNDVLEARKMYRPWMSMVWDWGSRRVMGMIWAPTPSSRTINAAIRMAVAEFGLPRNFYWDNGKDFQAVGRALLSDELSGILAANSVEITNALPYNARSKPIEPFFQRIAHHFDRKWGAAYCSNRPELCSAKCRDAQKEHKLFQEGKAYETPLRSDKEFIMAAAQEIDEYNAEPNQYLNGRSPNEAFQQQCPPAARRMVERRMLDRLFWQRDRRVIHQGGCVELNKLRYEPRDDESFARLSGMWKSEVTVARDPWDLGIAVAYDVEGGEFLGELQVQQPVAQSPHGRLSVDGIKAMRRKRGAMLRSAQAYISALEQMTQANGWKSEVDSLLSRAGVLATGTDGRSIAPNAPGAAQGLPPARGQRQLSASPFTSDAVKEDAALFAEFFAADSAGEKGGEK